jgi:flagellar hook-basal body complex protein FliE
MEAGKKKTAHNPKSAPPNRKTLKMVIKDVKNMQNHADRSIEKMATGEITDVHQVMEAVEEADTAFSLMMELRKKMRGAYKEILRMQV